MKSDTPPDWPQPLGIFENGTTFNPIPFLCTIRDMYEKIVIDKAGRDDLAIEYYTFAKLLQGRTTVTADGTHLFRLYDSLDLPLNTPSELIVKQNGFQYLRIDCLRD